MTTKKKAEIVYKITRILEEEFDPLEDLEDTVTDKKLLGSNTTTLKDVIYQGVIGNLVVPEKSDWGTFEGRNGVSLTVHVEEVRYAQ